MTDRHTGGCLCGAIRYEISGTLEPIQLCHCGQCRKAQGSAFAANMPVQEADFHLLAGASFLNPYESSSGKVRAFCARCGSPIYSRKVSKPGVLRIRVGTLDTPIDTHPAVHFQVAHKANWWTITDTLPQHPGPLPDSWAQPTLGSE